MSDKTEKIVARAVQDPGRLYGRPGNVLNDARLTPEEKKTILESWEQDEKRLLDSSAENMPEGGPQTEEPPEELLQTIQEAERELKNKGADRQQDS